MRLIDADALYETLCHIWDRTDSEDFAKAVFREIENAPVVEERKTGEWIYIRDEENGNGLYECPICHHGDIHAPEAKVKFCWNCGAKMEGEKDE